MRLEIETLEAAAAPYNDDREVNEFDGDDPGAESAISEGTHQLGGLGLNWGWAWHVQQRVQPQPEYQRICQLVAQKLSRPPEPEGDQGILH
ncbi:hypothetical protein FKW77_001231 [Venturia effusa]|uniref:Uncharacterized protein n=1 Tax=Venturia effusa TaxID=50376 RepID=A0A517LJM2_9PEZI|nr:hypothetical protein FKW77_001231 [Venturia effusa]